MSRKILIEVTEEEYEKIKNGALNKNTNEKRPALDDFKTNDLVRELIKRTPQENKWVRAYIPDPLNENKKTGISGFFATWWSADYAEHILQKAKVSFSVEIYGETKEGDE